MNSRLPKLIFALLALYAVIHFSAVYPQLPDAVASHFDGRGTANGWQTKQAFIIVFAGVTALCVLVGFGLASLFGVTPMRLINLPNKQYWLAPEHRDETLLWLKAYFGWFACPLYVLMIVVYDTRHNPTCIPTIRPASRSSALSWHSWRS